MTYMQMIRSYIYRMVFMVCFLAGTTVTSAQTLCDNWSIQTQIDSATCKANGRIAITITGADRPSISSLLYSLTPISGTDYKVTQSASALLENVPPGTYDITVEGVCSSVPVSKVTQVRVPGTYKNVGMSLAANLQTYGKCAFGGIECRLTDGSKPFVLSILDAPAGYTGTREFTTNDNIFQIANLNEGRYKIAVQDGCNTRKVDSSSVIKGNLPADPYLLVATDKSTCKSYVTSTPRFFQRPDLASHFTYAFSYNGGPIEPFRNFSGRTDTLVVPQGTTLNDMHLKYVKIFLKSDCGDTSIVESRVYGPMMSTKYTINCNAALDLTYEVDRVQNICFPLYVKLKNNLTGEMSRLDTLTSAGGANTISRNILNIEKGDYRLILTDNSGYVLSSLLVSDAPAVPYSISLYPWNGAYGDDGRTGFTIFHRGRWMNNSVIQLVSPANFFFYVNMKNTPADGSVYIQKTNDANPQSYPPGSYLFRVTDSCGTYDLPIVVTEQDVYRYNWSLSSRQTCGGLEVRPFGTKSYGGQTDSIVYFKIHDGPADIGKVITKGDKFVLTKPGNYTLAIGANAYILNFGVNLKTISYTAQPELNIDRRNSLGWVCPGAAPNTGAIRAFAVGGKSGVRQYTYKLAIQGNGANGPYLDSNTTGYFTSNARYSLMKNTSYSLKVIDDCETSIVQDIQILDFATYQIITTDKPMFCVGDTVFLKAINLPTTAKNYYWEFPNSSTVREGQSQVIYNVDSSKAGKYKVTINSDLCGQPIKGEVDIKVAPYTVRCYSAVTDTSVNPYIHGLLGNWRPYRSYTYYGARAQADPAVKTDIRKDGAYNDFMTFWERQTASWTPRQDTSRWVWNAESTVFSKKGFELENKDPLGRYNAGLYGYDGAVPVAVIQNSRYRESGFDGFEDYNFTAGNCDDGLCPLARHFDFTRYKNKLSGEQSHTGRYSLKAAKGDSIMLSALVTDSDRLLTAPDFQQAVKCNTNVLKAVRLNPGVLVPEFSPVAGKRFLFSVWVKEEQDCKCTAYSGSEITLLVGGPVRVTATAQPKGAIIDGWQQYEGVIDVPKGATAFNVVIVPKSNVNVYYDDLRIHPYNANMKSFVYDPVNLRLMAELDENNYATLYEYDDDGTLTRVKKETERGIKTIKETRSALLKETAQR